MPELHSLDEPNFLDKLGIPETGTVRRRDGKSLEGNVPSYLVRPAQFRKRDMLLQSPSVKIIDYGEAFFNNNPPYTLHTPLSVRAPEVIFGDLLNKQVDMWSAGCLVNDLSQFSDDHADWHA